MLNKELGELYTSHKILQQAQQQMTAERCQLHESKQTMRQQITIAKTCQQRNVGLNNSCFPEPSK